jgi:cellulose synthase operon protein C
MLSPPADGSELALQLARGPVPLPGARAEADALTRQGLYLQASTLLEALRADPDPRAHLSAARIEWHLGAHRRGDAAVFRLWRHHRGNAYVLVDMLRTLGMRRGPYRLWERMQALGLPADAPADAAAEWHSLHAFQLALLRDFDAAEAAYHRARELAPDDAWVLTEWAYASEHRDKHAEGIALAEEALRLQPGSRAAVQALAHLYTLVGRDTQALALLQDAFARSESADLGFALAALQSEQGQHEAALRTVQRCGELLPLADADMRKALAARRSDYYLRLGDLPRAREEALAAGNPFHRALAERLLQPGVETRRVLLNVGFVRQHFNTCAPATLAALSGYWAHQAEHLQIVEEICYDGTPNHSERRWAEEQGFHAREFTVDWNTARALLDRGVPFTLVTVGTGSAHLQAVIGYDELRGSLLIRDPTHRTYAEFDAKALFESHRASGPRGMLLLPPDECTRLNGIALPHVQLWDRIHALMTALSAHRREEAVAIAKAMTAEAPNHPLTIQALRSIASYDGNETELLACTDSALELFPDEPNLMLAKASLLSVLGSRKQLQDWWEHVHASPRFDAVSMLHYVRFIGEDRRRDDEADRLLARVVGTLAIDGNAWHAMASRHWLQGRRDMAVRMFRIAACLQEMNEGHAESYSHACVVTGLREEALRFLERRVQRLGSRSDAPLFTLFNWLCLADRTEEAFSRLDEAIVGKPARAELLLFAADAALRYGKVDDALQHLAAAEVGARRSRWLRLKALCRREQGSLDEALVLLREAAEQEPQNPELHRLIAAVLLQREGRDAALAHLDSVCRSHPHHFELNRLRLSWLPDHRLADQLAHLDHLVNIAPHNAWAHRERAVKLSLLRRHEDAQAAAAEALRLAPLQSETHSTLGFLARREGRLEEARLHLRRAVELSVDDSYAVSTLPELDTDLVARRETLHFIRDELLRQVTLGDGLLTFLDAARVALEPTALMQLLQQAHEQRPDLWQSWVALASQRLRLGEGETAHRLLEEALQRFALVPRLHIEQAKLLLAHGERDAARAALQRALAIDPWLPQAVRMYVDSVLDEGDSLERADAVLRPALQRMPSHADLRALHGWLLWRQKQPSAAINELRAAIAIDPDLGWAWEALAICGRQDGCPGIAAEVAEDTIRLRPGDPVAWLRLAQYAASPQQALQAADEGLRLEPRYEALYEKRLSLLLDTGREDEVCRSLADTPWGQATPINIAMVEARLARARGNLSEAIAIARRLLTREPQHFATWREVADWLDARDDVTGYLAAAREMVSIAPLAPQSHGYLGHALLRDGQAGPAAESLERALTLDPTYAFAGLQLVDLDLQAGNHDRAERTIAALSRQERTPFLALRHVRLALARDDDALTAAQVKEALQNSEPAYSGVCKAVLDDIRGRRVEPLVLEVIEELIIEGRCALPAVQFWIDQHAGGLLHDSPLRAVLRATQRDPGHCLKQGFAESVGRQGQRRWLDRLVKAHRDEMHHNTGCWGSVGYAYLAQDRNAEAVMWLGDWQRREDAPAWALDNLALALRRLGRHTQAAEVTQRSLELLPNNHEARTWLALDAALEDRVADLPALIGAVDVSSLIDYYRHVMTAVQAYLDAASVGDSSKALGRFGTLRALKGHSVLRNVLPVLRRSLLKRHTPPRIRWWRTLQFRFGWR